MDEHGPTAEAPTVFLSYARDDRKRALPIIKALETAGIKVWWDGLLEGGETYLKTTEAALESADAVVVLWSGKSVESHWVRDEAQSGRDRARLVPLLLGGATPPLGFRQFQTIDLSHWRGRSDAPEMQAAVRAIRAVAGHAGPAPAATKPTARLSRRAVFAGAAAIGAGLAGEAAWQFWPGAGGNGDSIAVLPFRNLGSDPDQAFFAQGVSEQIRLALSRNPRLSVLGAASVAAAIEVAEVGTAAIAERLGAGYVLSGAVRRADDTLRISAELTDTASGVIRWTDEFRKGLDDVFAVQDEIAARVVAAMAAQTFVATAPRAAEPGGTRDFKAYEAYLRGNAYYNLRSGDGAYRAALAQYDAAIARDPAFAAAHAARARVAVVLTNSTGRADSFAAAYDDALRSARKAVALAPEMATAYSTLGFVLVNGKLDLRGAAAPYRRARELGGGDGSVLSLYAAYAAQMGQRDKAGEAIARALARDPLNPGVYRLAAYIAYCARDWSKALEHDRKALSLNPQIDQVHAFIGDALYQQGDAKGALAAYAREPSEMFRLTGMAIAARRLGDATAADKYAAELVGRFGEGAAYQQAQIAAQAGDRAGAMDKLRYARRIGDVGLALALTDPLLDPLRDDPGFAALLRDIGFG